MENRNEEAAEQGRLLSGVWSLWDSLLLFHIEILGVEKWVSKVKKKHQSPKSLAGYGVRSFRLNLLRVMVGNMSLLRATVVAWTIWGRGRSGSGVKKLAELYENVCWVSLSGFVMLTQEGWGRCSVEAFLLCILQVKSIEVYTWRYSANYPGTDTITAFSLDKKTQTHAFQNRSYIIYFHVSKCLHFLDNVYLLSLNFLGLLSHCTFNLNFILQYKFVWE